MGAYGFRLVSLLAFAGAAVACPGPGAGKPGKDDKEGKNVKVTVVVILASEDKGEVDKRLTQIADEVQKKKPELRTFKFTSQTCESLEVGQKVTFKTVDDKVVHVVVKHGADKNDRVGLGVTPPLQNEIVYR